MKLNLGCGATRITGFINVDAVAACSPDVVHDLESFPWPWPNDSVEEVLLSHVLEHLGQSPKVFLKIMQELYRVCQDGARIHIAVPHPRHDFYLGDPTHVRPITPLTLSIFNRAENERWQKMGAANTPLAIYLGIDFVLTHTNVMLDKRFRDTVGPQQVLSGELLERASLENNVIEEYRMELTARKPAKTA